MLARQLIRHTGSPSSAPHFSLPHTERLVCGIRVCVHASVLSVHLCFMHAPASGACRARRHRRARACPHAMPPVLSMPDPLLDGPTCVCVCTRCPLEQVEAPLKSAVPSPWRKQPIRYRHPARGLGTDARTPAANWCLPAWGGLRAPGVCV